MESIVKIVKNKVKESPLVMFIPMRRREEPRMYGTLRRRVNRKCLDMLDDWSCEGLRLNERKWGRVWQQDGVHLSSVGKAWGRIHENCLRPTLAKYKIALSLWTTI